MRRFIPIVLLLVAVIAAPILLRRSSDLASAARGEDRLVIISPHNASASRGNEKRCAEMFVANFGHWLRGEPMFNVQRVS